MLRRSTAIFLACLILALLWATSALAEDVYVTVPWKDQQIQIRARLYHPAGPGPFPGVILLHHCGGLNSEYSNALPYYASMLVQQGYAVAAPDSIARDWKFERPLRESLAAKGAKMAAVVALYGESCGDPDKAAVIVPLLGLFGGRDNTRNDVCQALAAQSKGLMQVHIYPDDFHAFDVASGSDLPDQPHSGRGTRAIISYDPSAAQDSHARVLAFFAEHLK
jgi:dienelactone hydrolase